MLQQRVAKKCREFDERQHMDTIPLKIKAVPYLQVTILSQIECRIEVKLEAVLDMAVCSRICDSIELINEAKFLSPYIFGIHGVSQGAACDAVMVAICI